LQHLTPFVARPHSNTSYEIGEYRSTTERHAAEQVIACGTAEAHQMPKRARETYTASEWKIQQDSFPAAVAADATQDNQTIVATVSKLRSMVLNFDPPCECSRDRHTRGKQNCAGDMNCVWGHEFNAELPEGCGC
jgi:hypothetical protein